MGANTATMDMMMPYYEKTGSKTVASTDKQQKVFLTTSANISTDDACKNLGKQFPDFTSSPETFLKYFKNLEKLDGTEINQQTDIQQMKRFIAGKFTSYNLVGFSGAELFNEVSLDKMADYLGERFRQTVKDKYSYNVEQTNNLRKSIETNFLGHVHWYLEKQMNDMTKIIHRNYIDSFGDKKKVVSIEERHHYRDTLASLNEYKINLIKKYLEVLRNKIFTEPPLSDIKLEDITLREIKKPFQKLSETGVSGVVGRVKNFFKNLF